MQAHFDYYLLTTSNLVHKPYPKALGNMNYAKRQTLITEQTGGELGLHNLHILPCSAVVMVCW